MDEALWPVASLSIMVVLAFLGIVIIWRTRREMKSGYPIDDERTSRINGKAALRAYYVGYFFMVAELLWIIAGREFLGLPEMESGWLILAAMMAMGLSFGAFRWYYGREGDSP